MKIDYSQLNTYISCPKKYYNKYKLNLKKVSYDEREIDKDFGSAIHGGLEVYYKTKSKDKSLAWFRENFNGLESEKVKTPANGLSTLSSYIEYWKANDSDLSDNKLEVLAVEQVDSYKIGHIDYIVKIDRIVKSNAGIFALDTKTTTRMAYNYFWQYDPNMQVSGYCEYVRQKYGQCSGIIIDAVCVGHRERKYLDKPAGFHCELVRDIINRNTDQLDDFKNNVIGWVDRLEHSNVTNTFCKNESACHNFKGCEYKELCTSCHDEEIMNTLYEKSNTKSYLENSEVVAP